MLSKPRDPSREVLAEIGERVRGPGANIAGDAVPRLFLQMSKFRILQRYANKDGAWLKDGLYDGKVAPILDAMEEYADRKVALALKQVTAQIQNILKNRKHEKES